MRKYNIEGIVLKSINYRDSDKLYTLFTPSRGKITVQGRGVRKISSRRGGNLDTLNYISTGISESINGYKTVTEVKSINSFISLKSSLSISTRAYYLLELVHRFIEEEDITIARPVFTSLLKTVTKLNESKSELSTLIIVNAFELNFMQLLGYGLSLEKCTKCGKPFSLDWELYKVGIYDGGFICDTCSALGVSVTRGTAQVLNYITRYNNKTLKDGKKFSIFSREDIYAADELIKYYISETLEGSFKTIRVFKNLI